MNRITRNALAGALAAAVALGAAAPAAVAAPKASHAKVDHRSAKAQKTTKAERRLAADQRWFGKQVMVKVRQLERIEFFRPLTRLDQDVKDVVLGNIADDVAELKLIKGDGLDGTRQALKGLRSEARQYRPNVYKIIVNHLAWADRLDAKLADLDVTDATLATQVASASAKVDEAVAMLLGYDADTTARELRAAKRVLSSARSAFETVSEETPDTEAPDTGE